MADDQRLEAISEALARIIRRQDALEARLARMEASPPGFPVEPPPVEYAPPPIPIIVPEAMPEHAPPPLPAPVSYAPPPPIVYQAVPPPPPPPPQTPRAPSVALETLVGLNWINIAGVVTLLFAAIFGFKYAVDNNYIGPTARVVLGIVAATVALFMGDLMWKKGQKIFGQGITGLGLALLYVTFWAAFGLYHLFPQPVAFALMVLTTAASVVFAMRYESQTIAVIGMVAAYWVPGALSSGEARPWVLFVYLFLLNLGGLALTRLRKWLAMEYLAAFATILWYGAWMGVKAAPSDHVVATVFALAFYAQFCFAQGRPLWAVAQLLGPAALLNISMGPEPFVLLLLTFAAGGLVVSEIRKWVESPTWTLTCFWAIYFLGVAGEKKAATPELRFAYLTAGFALFFFWVIWWAVIQKRVLRNTDMFVLAANAAAYFGASYYLLNPTYHAYMGLFAAALAGLNLLLAKMVFTEKDKRPALMAIAVTLTFLTLAAPIQFAGFRITIAWAVEGAALAWLSSRFNSTKMGIGASIVLVLTVLRLFTVDTVFFAGQKDLPLFVNGRFLVFAVTAASLFAAAKFLDRSMAPVAYYIGGHLVTLLALGIELVMWVQKSVAEADQFQTSTVAISILMALYALILVTLGVATKTSINRIMGLVLMTLVVLKLYLSDVWELGFAFKLVAFLGLGVLLLSVSYLYSRFRPVIEKLWKDDPSA